MPDFAEPEVEGADTEAVYCRPIGTTERRTLDPETDMWTKIWWILGIGFFPPSLLFAILWGILKQDIQGVFGVASWWMAGATIVVGIVGTSTWTM